MSRSTHMLDKLVAEIQSLKGEIERLEAEKSQRNRKVEDKLIEARKRALKAGHGMKGQK